MAKEKKELSKTEKLMRAWFSYNYWNSCCEDEAIEWSQHDFNLSAKELEAFLEWRDNLVAAKKALSKCVSSTDYDKLNKILFLI